jgi:hypothetical protein
MQSDTLPGKYIYERQNEKEPGVPMDIAILDVKFPKLVGRSYGVISADSSYSIFTDKIPPFQKKAIFSA